MDAVLIYNNAMDKPSRMDREYTSIEGNLVKGHGVQME